MVIYFDNAATSLHKPARVMQAVRVAMQQAGGYGRSGHRPAMRAGEIVYRCRELAAKLFGLQAPEQVVFTLNATHALNQAIFALTNENTVAAVSGYEHNSVIRPLHARGVPYLVMEHTPFDQEMFLGSAKKALEAGANLFIINHVSNVFGGIIPLAALDKMLADAGVPLILDASQSAGTMQIDVRTLRSVAAICMPGHKGLLGPQGTGMLLVCSDAVEKTLMQGGTGSVSSDLEQPTFLPDRFESGTPNVVGIAGLAEGLEFVLRENPAKIGMHERGLLTNLADRLESLEGLTVLRSIDPANQAGVLSFFHTSLPCEIIAERLAERDVCVRAGLHCAPFAHRSAGTLKTGTVRASFGPFNNGNEVDLFAEILTEIVDKV